MIMAVTDLLSPAEPEQNVQNASKQRDHMPGTLLLLPPTAHHRASRSVKHSCGGKLGSHATPATSSEGAAPASPRWNIVFSIYMIDIDNNTYKYTAESKAFSAERTLHKCNPLHAQARTQQKHHKTPHNKLAHQNRERGAKLTRE
jgi:hypothetical protein